MATKVFDLYAEISLDNSSYMEGLKSSESAGKSFESTVKGLIFNSLFLSTCSSISTVDFE